MSHTNYQINVKSKIYIKSQGEGALAWADIEAPPGGCTVTQRTDINWTNIDYAHI